MVMAAGQPFLAGGSSKSDMLTNAVRAIRFACRALLRDKGFALTAVLSIGLGAGANAAIYSLVNQALFRLLPVREPERLVLLDWGGTFVGKGWGSDNLMSYLFYRDLRDETDVFEGVFGRAPTFVNAAVDNHAETVSAEIVTGSYFRVLGVRTQLGRTIEDSDDLQPDAHPVVVVSSDYWHNHLGGRSDVVGRTIFINTHPMTVIGVAEPAFHGIDWGEVPALWVPTMMKRQATPDFDWLLDRRGRWLHVFGRLKPGMTADQAQAALQPWFKTMLRTDTTRDDWPRVTADQERRYLASSLRVLPASTGRSDLRGRLERPLIVLLAATTIVLLLACLNVANLYLAGGFARRRETALRLALGASRGRIVRELLVQSGMLACGGAVLGAGIAPTVIRALLSFLPHDSAAVALSDTLNMQVFVFALAASVVTAVLFSVAPAFRTAQAEPSLTLKQDSSTISAGISLRKALVVGQVALALVLLAGAGLFVQTLASLRAKGPGFDSTNLIMLRVDASRNGYSPSRAMTLVRNLAGAVRSVPDVENVALSVGELLSGGSWNQQITIDAGRRFATDSVVHCNAITPEFFDTLAVPLVAGRNFGAAENNPALAWSGDGPPRFRTAIINESLAHRYFGTRNPIGSHLGLGNGPDTKADVEIVGVVRTFSYRGLRETEDQAFFPFFQGPVLGGVFWIRTHTPAAAAFAAIRNAVRSIDPSLPTSVMRTVDDQVDRSLANERLVAALASGFAILAILLALVGVYGVTSFVVAHRTREIGIRVALGASHGSAIWLVLRETTMMLCAGIAIALPVVWSAGRLIESQLFGVHATDWHTAVGAIVLVALAGMAASALPVRRATAINPIEALRCE
jgi:predicted permease